MQGIFKQKNLDFDTEFNGFGSELNTKVILQKSEILQ